MKRLSNVSAFECVWKICWLLVGAAGAVSPQQLTILDGPGTPQAEVHRHTITGMVVNAISGEPIRRALVQGWSQQQISVLTGPDGRFQIADVAEGMLNLTAQKPGFFDARAIPGFASIDALQWLTVDSGKNDFKLVLYPSAKIFGHIKDKDGEPIGGATVQVLAEQIDAGRKSWQQRNGSQTEDDGSFEIVDLMPGKYLISTSGHADRGEIWNQPIEVFRPAYFPNAADMASAQVVELRAGQEFRADFSLKSERGYNVSVQLSGSPIQRVAPMIQTESGMPIQIGFLNRDNGSNTWTLGGVPSGNWVLSCFANDSQGRQYHGRLEIAVNHADVDHLQLVLHPALTIPVTINHATPPAASGGVESIIRGSNSSFPYHGISATMRSVDPLQTAVFGMQPQAESGTWVIPNVTPGKYRLDIQASGNECVESEWYGGVDVLRDELVINPDDAAQPLTVNLRSDCATLTVKVRAGKKLRMYTVLVVPQPGTGSPRLEMVPSESSQMPMVMGALPPFLALAPGSYDLYAFNNIAGLEYANPEVLSGYSGKHIDLSAGQKTEIVLEPIERTEN